jgi:hypothetical protein
LKEKMALGPVTWQGGMTANGPHDYLIGSHKTDTETEGVPADDGPMNWTHSSWKGVALEEALGKLLHKIVGRGRHWSPTF